MEKKIVNFSYVARFIALVLGFISIALMIVSFNFVALKMLGISILSWLFFSIFISSLDTE